MQSGRIWLGLRLRDLHRTLMVVAGSGFVGNLTGWLKLRTDTNAKEWQARSGSWACTALALAQH